MDIQFDIIFVGAGPASLAGAIRLNELAKKTNTPLRIAIIEKAPHLGDHTLSGATFDPTSLASLIPDYSKQQAPLGPKVTKERYAFLTRQWALPLPFVLPPMSNKGKHMISLSDMVRWMGQYAKDQGIAIYTGEVVQEVITDDHKRVIGVIVKEKGRDIDGNLTAVHVPGTRLGASIVVLGEGARGHITQTLIHDYHLDDARIAQGYALGLKELWEVPENVFREGFTFNAFGHPLGLSTFGGGFMYHIKECMVGIGFVTSLDYKNPHTHPFHMLQQFKAHPTIANYLKNARFVSYGAKTICEGGWYALPKMTGPGFIIIGEGAGLLDTMQLKGIDLAIESGMLAAKTIMAAYTANDFSDTMLSQYEADIRQSNIGINLYKARNFHQGFHHGIVLGMGQAVLQYLSNGRGIWDRISVKPDAKCMQNTHTSTPNTPDLSKHPQCVDKLSAVYASGTAHEENQPCHIHISDRSICNTTCKNEFGNPCQFFCPANVFEITRQMDGRHQLHLNPENCLHCKTCAIKDPYGIVNWQPPQGGDGPNYRGM